MSHVTHTFLPSHSALASSPSVQHDVGVQVLADVNVVLQDVMKNDDQNFSAAMPLNVVLCGGMRNQSFCPTNRALEAAEWQCRAAPRLSPPKRVASRSTARAQESSSAPCTTGSPRVSMVHSWVPHVPRGTRRHLETPRISWPSSLSPRTVSIP